MAPLSPSDVFVSTGWLADRLANPDVIPVDASWYMPAQARDPEAEFLGSHIPGAVFFDIDKIADTFSGLPHMLPAPDMFAAAVGALGIAEDSTVVVYDETGLFSAPRAWWTFHAMGARDVRILSGGGAQWRREGRPLESGPARRPPRTFQPHLDATVFVDFTEVDQRRHDRLTSIVDARPADRFSGKAPEPRPGLRSGHIPGSLNVPVGLLSEAGQMKSPEALLTVLAEAGVDPAKPAITTCGSGITASTLALALRLVGADSVSIYDGSWTEWGSRPGAEIA